MNPCSPVHMSASFRILSSAKSTISFPTTARPWISPPKCTGVVSSSEVVGGIFFPADKLFGVEQLAVRASAHFIYHRGLQVQKHTARNVLPGASFTEERVEGVISSSHCLVTRHLTIRLYTMLSSTSSTLKFRISRLKVRQASRSYLSVIIANTNLQLV